MFPVKVTLQVKMMEDIPFVAVCGRAMIRLALATIASTTPMASEVFWKEVPKSDGAESAVFKRAARPSEKPGFLTLLPIGSAKEGGMGRSEDAG